MYKCVVPLTLFTSKVLEYFYSFCYFGALLFNKTFFFINMNVLSVLHSLIFGQFEITN